MEYLDKPGLDDTPRAHPAFYRGKATGIYAVLKIVQDIIDGSDNGTGENNHPGIEQMRQSLLSWREDIRRKAKN